MKKLFTYSIIIFMVGLSFISCQKEQSEFNFTDIKDSARIQGVIRYNRGDDGSSSFRAILPAADVRVLIRVPNNNYSTGAIGSKVYEVKSSKEGEYSVEIPVNNVGFTGVTIDIEPFEASFYAGDDTYRDVLFGTYTAPTVSVLRLGDIEEHDLLITHSILPILP